MEIMLVQCIHCNVDIEIPTTEVEPFSCHHCKSDSEKLKEIFKIQLAKLDKQYDEAMDNEDYVKCDNIADAMIALEMSIRLS